MIIRQCAKCKDIIEYNFDGKFSDAYKQKDFPKKCDCGGIFSTVKNNKSLYAYGVTDLMSGLSDIEKARFFSDVAEGVDNPYHPGDSLHRNYS